MLTDDWIPAEDVLWEGVDFEGRKARIYRTKYGNSDRVCAAVYMKLAGSPWAEWVSVGEGETNPSREEVFEAAFYGIFKDKLRTPEDFARPRGEIP